MKISVLIQRLEALLPKVGDVEVVDGYDRKIVVVREAEKPLLVRSADARDTAVSLETV